MKYNAVISHTSARKGLSQGEGKEVLYPPVEWREVFEENHQIHVDGDSSMLVERTLERINQSALKFLAPLTLEETYTTVGEEALSLVKGVDAAILFFHPHAKQMQIVYNSSPNSAPYKLHKRSYAFKSFSDRQAFVVDLEQLSEIHPDLIKAKIHSILFIPLFYQDKSIGTLIVRSREESRLLSEELEILKVFGSMASLAIRKAQLYAETEKALKIRDLFISMTAHELKTPLTAISGYAQLLHTKLKHEASRETRWVEQLLYETRRLATLVDELVQTQTIKSGKLSFRWTECSLRQIIRQAIDSYHFTYPGRIVFFDDQLNIAIDSIIGDFNKLRQVFDNLLDNAGKYAPENSPIKVTLSFEEPFFVIQVQDEGVGITKEDLPHVFEEFYKSKEHTEEGMGLGLYLVKNIITQHHGKITITSLPKQGTCVEIRLRKMKI